MRREEPRGGDVASVATRAVTGAVRVVATDAAHIITH